MLTSAACSGYLHAHPDVDAALAHFLEAAFGGAGALVSIGVAWAMRRWRTDGGDRRAPQPQTTPPPTSNAAK